MPIIEITTGSVTTKGNGSLNVHAFYRKNAKERELPMHEADRDGTHGIRSIGSVETSPSSSRLANLKWVMKRNEYPEGGLIRLNITETVKGLTFNRYIYNLILRARSTAALRELAIKCPTDANSTRGHVDIVGRFDILTPEEVQEYGLHLNAAGRDDSETFEHMVDLEHLIEQRVLEAEISKPSKPNLQKVTGKGPAKVMPKLTVKRRIRLPS